MQDVKCPLFGHNKCTLSQSWDCSRGPVDSTAACSVLNLPKAGITPQQRQSFKGTWKRSTRSGCRMGAHSAGS